MSVDVTHTERCVRSATHARGNAPAREGGGITHGGVMHAVPNPSLSVSLACINPGKEMMQDE